VFSLDIWQLRATHGHQTCSYLEIKFRVALVRVRIAGEEEDALGRHLALNRKLYTCKLSRIRKESFDYEYYKSVSSEMDLNFEDMHGLF
jgi:hypothetical protein